MKKLIKNLSIIYAIYIALLVVISFTGCSTTKKLEKTKSDIALNSDLESKKKVDETTNVKTTASGETGVIKSSQSSENQSKESETKTTKYDPSKPIVPGTGKPPVIEETTTTEKSLSQKDNKILEETRTKNNLLIEENKRLKQSNDSLLKVKYKESSKSETKESKSVTGWKLLIAGFILGTGITVLVYQMKWYEIVWNFIKKLFRVNN